MSNGEFVFCAIEFVKELAIGVAPKHLPAEVAMGTGQATYS